MAEHDVHLEINHRITIQHVDAEFPVRSDGRLLGRLLVSKGSVDWVPAFGSRHRLGWEQFDQLMRENGHKVAAD
jgi:hypothetical protein